MVHPSALLTVVVSASVLSAGLASVSASVAVLVAVSDPVAVGETTTVTVALPAAAMVPRVQVTVGALIEQEPWLGVAETMVRAEPLKVVARLTVVALTPPVLATDTV